MIEVEPRWLEIRVRLVEPRVVGRREARTSAVAEIRLGRSQGPPVRGDLEALGLHGHEIRIDAFRAGLKQQLLDDLSAMAYSPSPKWWYRIRPSVSAMYSAGQKWFANASQTP